MIQRRLTLLILSFLTFSTASFADELETRLIELIEKRKVTDLKSTIESIKQKYPSHAIIFYADAFLEEDGKIAYDKYLEFITRFPGSNYVNHAKFKLAQYYYAQGLYQSAKRMLTEILKNRLEFDDDMMDDVYYLLIQNFIALEEINEAKIVLNEFLDKYRKSDYYKLVKQDYEWLKDTPESDTTSDDADSDHQPVTVTLQGKQQGYTLQVGAFLNPENAENLHAKLEELGYKTRIKQQNIDNKLFFLVMVGSFASRDQALEFGAEMVRKHGINFRAVNE